MRMRRATYLWPLTVEDIPAIEKLEGETGLAFWGQENYRRFIEESPEYFGCKVEMEIVNGEKQLAGFLLARALFDDLEILKIGIFPAFSRQGMGTMLMEAAYAEGIERGCRRCFLEVRKSNSNAMEFYYYHRFKVTGSRINYYTDPVEDAWIMERSL